MNKLLVILGITAGAYLLSNKHTFSPKKKVEDFTIFPGYKVSCKSIIITDQEKANEYAFKTGEDFGKTIPEEIKNEKIIDLAADVLAVKILGSKADCVEYDEDNLKLVTQLLSKAVEGLASTL